MTAAFNGWHSSLTVWVCGVLRSCFAPKVPCLQKNTTRVYVTRIKNILFQYFLKNCYFMLTMIYLQLLLHFICFKHYICEQNEIFKLLNYNAVTYYIIIIFFYISLTIFPIFPYSVSILAYGVLCRFLRFSHWNNIIFKKGTVAGLCYFI